MGLAAGCWLPAQQLVALPYVQPAKSSAERLMLRMVQLQLLRGAASS